MNTMADQNLVRRLRVVLNTEQQMYFSRVFVDNEDQIFVCYDMLLRSDFELTMLKALRGSMLLSEVIQLIKVRQHPSFLFVLVEDIPEPWRDRFLQYQFGSQAPVVDGLGPCVYASDWERWIRRNGFA